MGGGLQHTGVKVQSVREGVPRPGAHTLKLNKVQSVREGVPRPGTHTLELLKKIQKQEENHVL